MSDSPSRSEYVTNEPWWQPAGRADAIDEVADQFERPVTGAAEFWSHAGETRAVVDLRTWTSRRPSRVGDGVRGVVNG